jgi:hypothetical protein
MPILFLLGVPGQSAQPPDHRFFGPQPEDPIAPNSALSAKQFSANLVRDRSRILHGTWSTLNARLGRSRAGMEGFTTTVLRRAVIELEAYSHEAAAADDNRRLPRVA